MPTMPVTNQAPTALDNLYGVAASATTTTTPTAAQLSAANPYYNAINYNNTAAAAYGMYNPQCYVASTLRNAQAAAGVTTPFANYLTSPSAYYGTGYGTGPFDYAGYNANTYGYGSGRNSASGYYGSTTGIGTVGNGVLPYTDSLSASSSGGNTTSAQISPYPRAAGGEAKARKRTKNSKPKGGLTSPEPTYSRVFVWEFDDLCLGMANNINTLGNIVQVYGFQLKDPTECDQTNVEDANVDDTIQEICYNGAAPGSNNNNNVKLECGSPKIDSSDGSPPATVMPGSVPQSNAASRGCVAGLREMAARYQKMKEIYNQYRDSPIELENLCRHLGHVESLDEYINHADNYKMLDVYRQCLNIPMERCSTTNTYTNIIITSESLASTMAKLLLTKLAPFVPAENIYSSHKGSKMETFERVLQRFKKNMVIVSINRNLETKEFAKKENLPLWPIRTYPTGAPILQDVQNFYHALDKVLC